MKKAFFSQSLSKVNNEWPIQDPLHHQKLLDYYCRSNKLYRNSSAFGHKSVIKPENTVGFNSFHRTSFHWRNQILPKSTFLKNQVNSLEFSSERKVERHPTFLIQITIIHAEYFFLHPSFCDLWKFKFSFHPQLNLLPLYSCISCGHKHIRNNKLFYVCVCWTLPMFSYKLLVNILKSKTLH